MKLIDDWQRVARKAWSVRLILLAGVFSGVEAILPFLSHGLPPRLFAWLTLAVVMGALVTRFIAQKGLHDDD